VDTTCQYLTQAEITGGDTQTGRVQIQLRMSAVKPNMYRVYLNQEVAARMERICGKTGLGQSELLTKAVASALEAIEKNGGTFALPLKLEVQPHAYVQRENTAMALAEKPAKSKKS
jgi:hypothetical protein